MNKYTLYIITGFGLLLLLCFGSCKSDGMKPKDYKVWMDNIENGIIQEQIIGDYTFVAQYQTPEYIAVTDFLREQTDKTFLKQRVTELNGFVYFKMQATNILGKNAYADFSNTPNMYKEFFLQDDLKLVNNSNDTLQCVFYHYENHGGISPDLILFGFENDGGFTSNGVKMIYKTGFDSVGDVVFEYNKELLNTIPKLKI